MLLLLCVCAVLVGCGDGRTHPPDLSLPATPDGFMHTNFPAAGLRFNSPRDWRGIAGTPPPVVILPSGLAPTGVWRPPRDGALPDTRAALKAALHSLLALVVRRDPTFRRASAAVVAVA